jgi:uncharacterized protein (TIGR00106 family)
MKVSAMFSVIPIGVGVSLSRYVAACEAILREADVEATLHDHGTNVVGEWDAVFGALRKCHEAVHAMGAPRVSTFVKMGTRVDRETTSGAATRSVEEKLGG